MTTELVALTCTCIMFSLNLLLTKYSSFLSTHIKFQTQITMYYNKIKICVQTNFVNNIMFKLHK